MKSDLHLFCVLELVEKGSLFQYILLKFLTDLNKKKEGEIIRK